MMIRFNDNDNNNDNKYNILINGDDWSVVIVIISMMNV